MKKYFIGLLCLLTIVLMMSACGGDEPNFNDGEGGGSITESKHETTVKKEPIEVLTEAGLSQEYIDLYFKLVDQYHIELTADEFLKILTLPEKLASDYFNTFAFMYTADEYLQNVDKMTKDGFTEEQISNYVSFREKYTLDEYIQIINDMKNAGITEEQISEYVWFYMLYQLSPEAYICLCVNFDDQEIIDNYYFFSKKFSAQEYCDLIKKIRAATGEESAMPIYPLSDSLLFVRRNISTYDRVEESIAILNLDGEMVRNWNPEWGDYDIQHRAECGEYFFIITSASTYDYDCDVVNRNGQVITNITCKASRYYIGDGYVFFSFGGDWGQIMNPQGKVIKLQVASVWPSYCEKSMGSLAEGDSIGQISEGLFYGLSIGNNNTAAYYYNTNGEVVIDLSTQAVNFKVTKMYDFSDGQARIEFTGADYKEYYVFIDKTGAFIGEPVKMGN